MNIHKTVVVLLALLLAAMAMVPMVSAENSYTQSTEPNNQVTPATGITLQPNDTIVHSIDSQKYDTPITREKFISNNKEYIEFLAAQSDREAAMKTMNEKYTSLITAYEKQKSAQKDLKAPATITILQIWGADIFIWPWESQIQSTSDPNANPITFVSIGKSQYSLLTYLLDNGWVNALGDSEGGLSGSSLNSISWHTVSTYYQVENGNPLAYRYHVLIHPGLYESNYQKWWSYGECHYEYWNGNDHIILSDGFDSGESELYSTLSGAMTAYSTNFSNAMSGYFSGDGHVYYI
jgi:hypothetical protein